MILNASGNEMFARLGDVVAEVLAGRTAPPGDVRATRTRRRSPSTSGSPRRYGHGDAARAERYTREITVGALRELDILAP